MHEAPEDIFELLSGTGCCDPLLHWIVDQDICTLLFVEICAGSARLSFEFKLLGFMTLPIDHKGNKHSQRIRCVDLDITKRHNQNFLIRLVCNHSIIYVHLAPPCGTASRARERPIPFLKRQAGAPCPRPLRDGDNPRGIASLTDLEHARVSAANVIFDFCVLIGAACLKYGVLLSIENPRNSWFWTVAEQQAKRVGILSVWQTLEPVVFQHCMYGSERDKWTTLLCTPDVFSSLSIVCDRNHIHKPWAVTRTASGWTFDTAIESEYPKLLCERMSQIVLALCIQKGAKPIPVSLNDISHRPTKRLKTRAAAGALIRGRKLPQLVPEFFEIIESPTDNIPVSNHKVLRRFVKGGLDGTQQEFSIVGLYRSMEEFLDFSVCVSHPFDLLFEPDDIHKSVLFKILTSSPSDLILSRANFLKHLVTRKRQLHDEEVKLHDSLPVHLQHILAGKQLLLFKELLIESGYPDHAIVDEVIAGFNIVGDATFTPIFLKLLTPASLSPEELRYKSRFSRQLLIHAVESTTITADHKVLWESTMEEVDRNWLSGPYHDEQSVSEALGVVDWVACPRFPLNQSGKVRIIDDCKRGEVNSALTTYNKLELMDSDSLICLLRMVAESIGSSEVLELQLSNGEFLRGTKSSEWQSDPFWMGRCLDLKSAYKQLGYSKDQLWATVLLIPNPANGKATFFISKALMFGSTSSVYAFNRFSRAIWWLASKKLHLLCTNFYDDYPCVEPRLTAESSRLAFETMLDALGIWYAKDGSKALEFNSTFDVLGVRFDVHELHTGKFYAGNKPSRIQGLKQSLQSVLETSEMGKSHAMSIAGQLFFASGNCVGKAMRPAISIFQSFGSDLMTRCESSSAVIVAVKYLLTILDEERPRSFSVFDDKQPVIVFTDGSFENEGLPNQFAGVGAVIIDTRNNSRHVLDGVVPQSLLESWKSLVGLQVITQIELWPVVACLFVLPELFKTRRVIFFIDNDAARESLIRAFSPSLVSMSLIMVFYKQITTLESLIWFARVPSASNPADLPSRRDTHEACARFNAQYSGKLLLPKSIMKSLSEVKQKVSLLSTRADL